MCATCKCFCMYLASKWSPQPKHFAIITRKLSCVDGYNLYSRHTITQWDVDLKVLVLPIPVTERSNGVGLQPLAYWIAGSNPARGVYVCLL